jgi:hypothetical protein
VIAEDWSFVESPVCFCKDFCAGPVAQWLEQRTHNPLVLGSSPSRPTSIPSGWFFLSGRMRQAGDLELQFPRQEALDVFDLQEAMQLADAGRMPHFAERFGFDLPDAFARDAELFADFFQGAGVTVADAEAEFENLCVRVRSGWRARRSACP